MSVLPSTLHALIGSQPDDEALKDLVNGQEPESIKAYPDIVYYNYTSSGLSLQFMPSSGYKPPRSASKRADLNEKKLSLSTIDIYVFSYSSFPIAISYLPPTDPSSSIVESSSSSTLDLTGAMTGTELVRTLGEPDRKGGGESRSVGVWLEWTGLGLMAEFTSIHGAGSWDKEHGAGSAKVGIWSFFEPGKDVGKEDDD